MALDLRNKDPVRESIERQTAAKCAAKVLQGQNPTEQTIGIHFEAFLKLIRGEKSGSIYAQ